MELSRLLAVVMKPLW